MNSGILLLFQSPGIGAFNRTFCLHKIQKIHDNRLNFITSSFAAINALKTHDFHVLKFDEVNSSGHFPQVDFSGLIESVNACQRARVFIPQRDSRALSEIVLAI